MQHSRMQSEQLEAVWRLHRAIRNPRPGLASSQDVVITATRFDVQSRVPTTPEYITAAATSRGTNSVLRSGEHQGPVQQPQSSSEASAGQVLTGRASTHLDWVPVTTVVDVRSSTALSRLAASRRSSIGSTGTQTGVHQHNPTSTAGSDSIGNSRSSAATARYAAGHQHIPNSSVQPAAPASSMRQHVYTTAPAQSLQLSDVRLGQYRPTLTSTGATDVPQQHSMASFIRRGPSTAAEHPASGDAAPASVTARPTTSSLTGSSRPAQALAAARALDAMYTQQLSRATHHNVHSTSRAMVLPPRALQPSPQSAALDSSRPRGAPARPPSLVSTVTATASPQHRAASQQARRRSTAAVSTGQTAAATLVDGSLLQRPSSSRAAAAIAAAATTVAVHRPLHYMPQQAEELSAPTASAAAPAAVRVGGGFRLLAPQHAANLTQASRYRTGRRPARLSQQHARPTRSTATASASLVNDTGGSDSSSRRSSRGSNISTTSIRSTLHPSLGGTELSTATHLAPTGSSGTIAAEQQPYTRAAGGPALQGRSPLRLQWPAHLDFGVTASPFAAAAGAAAAATVAAAASDSPAGQLPLLAATALAAVPAAGSNITSHTAGRPVPEATLQASPVATPSQVPASGAAALQRDADNSTAPATSSHTSQGLSRNSSVMSLSELLEALREGYSLVPTSPTLADVLRPSPAPQAADISTVMQFGSLPTADQPPGTPVVVPTLLGVQAPAGPAPPAAGSGVTAAAVAAALVSAGGAPPPTARSLAAAGHNAAPSSSTAGSTTGTSSNSRSSTSSDQEVLMAVQLLTDSLQMLVETQNLIDSMLALGAGQVTAGPATSHQQAARSRGMQDALAASAASNTINARQPSRVSASSTTSTTSHADTTTTTGTTTTTTSSTTNTTDEAIVLNRHDHSSSASAASSYVAGNLSTCVVCMGRPRSVLLLPCKHLVLCGSCFDHMAADARSRQQDRNSTAAATTGPFLLDQDDETLMQRLLHREHVLSAPATFGGSDTARAGLRDDPPAGGGSTGPAIYGGALYEDAAAVAAGVSPGGVPLGSAAAASGGGAGTAALAQIATDSNSGGAGEGAGVGSGSDVEAGSGAVPRGRSSHREWLGPIPPGVVLPPGGTGLVDFHWWARPVQPDRQGSGLRAAGPDIEAARLSRQDVLLYDALVRCPLCRSAVEQSVAGVLVV